MAAPKPRGCNEGRLNAMLHALRQQRARLLKFGLPAVIGENPLEIAMIVWAFFSGLSAATGHSRSSSSALSALPDFFSAAWAVLMVVAALVVAVSLFRRADTLIATGMYLFSCTLIAYALAIAGVAGQSGFAASSLLLILGLVCSFRGWWLKQDEARLIRRTVRKGV